MGDEGRNARDGAAGEWAWRGRRDESDVRRGDIGDLVMLQVQDKNQEDRKEVFEQRDALLM
jgi:hypothetical protein